MKDEAQKRNSGGDQTSGAAFERALEFTMGALGTLKDSDSKLRGSREALARLGAARMEAARQVPPVLTVKAAAPVGEKPAVGQSPAEVFQTNPGTKRERMDQLRAAVAPCTKCPHLAWTRTQTVFGVGNIEARIMFVGEAPGADEDLQGEPFVGKAGQLLTKIIETMGVKREDVFIANVLKCRPDMPPGASGNRRPTTQEMRTCLPYLRGQIEVIQPGVLVALGSVAMEGLLGSVEPMARLRGRWHEFQGIPLMATYHPAYLLRNQSLTEKRKVWEDMLLVMDRVGLAISEKQRGYFLK